MISFSVFHFSTDENQFKLSTLLSKIVTFTGNDSFLNKQVNFVLPM